MLCAPIVFNGVVLGVLQVSNKKIIQQTPRSSRIDFTTLAFTSNEGIMLNYIAAIAGMALVQVNSSCTGTDNEGNSSILALPSQSPTFHEDVPIEIYRTDRINPTTTSTAAAALTVTDIRTDHDIQSLLKNAYANLDADRVSVFTYSAKDKNLICAVSKDIEGLTIPSDRGYAGICFKTMRIININDVQTDKQHYNDIDSKIGYKTKNLLCAPILSTDGIALGVVQAINKKNGSSFTISDEQQLIDVCKRIVYILKEHGKLCSTSTITNKKTNDTTSTSSNSVSKRGLSPVSPLLSTPAAKKLNKEDEMIFAKSVCYMMQSETLSELVCESERIIQIMADCDYTGLYALTSGTLVSISSTVGQSNQFLSEIPPVMKQALQFGTAVEFTLPSRSDSGDPHDLIPGISLQQALIYPLSAKIYPYKPGTAVLVIGKRTPAVSGKDIVRTPAATSVGSVGGKVSESWSVKTRARLDSTAEYINKALISLSHKLEHNDSIKLMKAQYNLVNNSLGALRDFVILLNEEGKFIGSNKIVEELLGFPSFANMPTNENNNVRFAASNGSQKPNPPLTPIIEGSHYTEWLNNGNSPELVRDIGFALKHRTTRSLDKVKFFSAIHQNGILIDYQVVPIENPELKDNIDIPTPRLMLSRPQSESSLPHDGDIIENLGNNYSICVVIHTENFHHQATLGPTTSNGKLNLSFSQMDTESAHGVVDAATTMVNNVRASFMLSEDVEEALKHITKSLNNASRKLSILGTATVTSAIQTVLQKDSVPLVVDNQLIPSDIFEWTFNVLDITDGMLLCSIIGKFFETLFDLNELNIDSSMLARYIAEIGKNYHDRPFHNLQHSACVSHFTFKLLTCTEAIEKLTKYQQFSILIGAVVHDVDHPGNTNLFEINSASELALRYNDYAVLENHHCSTAFRLMRKPNMQVLSTLSKTIANDIRKMIISCVMATDMAVHFELIAETNLKAKNGIDFDELKDQTFVGKILLHAADLSNPVRPFHMTREWARRISLEFNDQVIREQALGMPVLGFMMTPDEKAFCRNETGFSSFVVLPMWKAVSGLYPQLTFLVDQLEDNVRVWKETLENLLENEEKLDENSGSDKVEPVGSNTTTTDNNSSNNIATVVTATTSIPEGSEETSSDINSLK